MRATLSVAFMFFLGENRCETDLCSNRIGGDNHAKTIQESKTGVELVLRSTHRTAQLQRALPPMHPLLQAKFSATPAVFLLFESRRVLFCQLLCSVKKRKKYCACLTAEKQKTRAGAVWSTVPTPVSAVFSYIEGCLPLNAWKNLSCRGRQKRFL